MLVLLFTGLLLVSLMGRAHAASETCPARLMFWPSGQGPATTATRYDFVLRALSERSVDATIIADTDKGWFEWAVHATPLQRKAYLVKGQQFQYTYRTAESAILTVLFPVDTAVRHAWVATAKTSGEKIFGWDAKGAFNCDIPDLSKQGVKPEMVELHDPHDPSPVAATDASEAAPIAEPFAPTTCKVPFSTASLPGVVQPAVPDSLVGILAQPAVAILYVAISDKGKLVDTWILAGSGYPALDAAALNATRLSRYDAATAYCRHVGGVYTVVDEFTPP